MKTTSLALTLLLGASSLSFAQDVRSPHPTAQLRYVVRNPPMIQGTEDDSSVSTNGPDAIVIPNGLGPATSTPAR
jgi:hypothetical protein